MRRRDFCLGLSAISATAPLSARAQSTKRPVIGCLGLGSLEDARRTFAAVGRGLGEIGYVEGHDFDVEFRAADYRADSLRELAADLVQRNVSTIVALTTPSALVAKRATKSIPIVFFTGIDPVESGLVSSLNHPGGNATGFFTLGNTLNTKRLEILHEIIPAANAVAILISPAIGSSAVSAEKEVTDAAGILGIRAVFQLARTRDELAAAFDALMQENCRGLLVPGDAVFNNNADAVVAIAAKFGIPAIYPFREYALAGGLASYGPNFADGYRLLGTYAGRILRGASPGDLPVQQIVKVELVLNARAAKGLGITFPPTLLARADEVIE